ncbi:MAG: hypothetical protein WC254_05165 [Candidatus Woesearchaeota archaeon]|jgi:hypothetical protein
MQCVICKKRPVTVFQYCSLCVVHLIEKRARKYIKEHHKLKKGQTIVANTPLSKYFAEHVIHVPVNIINKKRKISEVIISTDTLNDCVVSFLERLFTEKKEKKTKELLLFSTITDQELKIYCKVHKIPFKIKQHKLKEILQKVEYAHPGTVYGLYKSKEELKKIF